MSDDWERRFKFNDTIFFSRKIMNRTISELRGKLSHISHMHKKSTNFHFSNRNNVKIKKIDIKELKNSILNKSNRELKISYTNLKQKLYELNSSKFNLKKIKIKNEKNNEIKSNLQLLKLNQKQFEHFLYRRIFLKKFKDREKTFNNRLNIIYSENISQYEKLLLKRNKNKHLKGNEIFVPSIYEGYSLNKVNEIKKKINFMKGVVDFTYPEIILFKIHFQNYSTKEKQFKRNQSFKLPFQKNDEMLKNININKTLNLSKSFNILNLKRNKSI